MEFCAERGLYVGNTYFKHRSLHKYARGQNGVETESMIDLVLVKRGYAVICAGYEGCERNGMRPLRHYMLYCVNS